MVIGLVSAKGSPGVMATALAFSAVAGSDGVEGLFVELDPSGGSVECWTGTSDEPGLIRVANGLRRAVDVEALVSSASRGTPAGVRSILAPTCGRLAESTIAAGERLVPALAELAGTVLVDAGRWSPTQPTARRVVGCEVVAVVSAPTVEGVEAARWLVDSLAAIVGVPVVLVLVGDRPYGPAEVAGVGGVPVAGVVALDRRGLAALVSGGGRAWERSALARSARTVLGAVRSLAAAEGVRADA